VAGRKAAAVILNPIPAPVGGGRTRNLSRFHVTATDAKMAVLLNHGTVLKNPAKLSWYYCNHGAELESRSTVWNLHQEQQQLMQKRKV
jgi:hypothetical protein